jgi:hypothetical protein
MERSTARERLARLELLGLLDELDAKHGAAEKAVTSAPVPKSVPGFGTSVH